MDKNRVRYQDVMIVLLLGLGLIAILFMQLKQSNFSFSFKPPLKPGVEAPVFSFPGLDGKMVSLSDYRGKIVFVNIWATWCPPCVEEMPSMEKLYRELNGGEDFEILAVSIDSMGEKAVGPFMKKYNLTFPALLDKKGTIKSIYRTTGVPESYIIDKNGILVEKVIGGRDWAQPSVFKYFRHLMEGTS